MKNAILPAIIHIAALLSPLYAQNPRGLLRSPLTRSRSPDDLSLKSPDLRCLHQSCSWLARQATQGERFNAEQPTSPAERASQV
jgi:hypothetical protein